MKAQVILTESGEELVVLPLRDYDALLARGGDEGAEIRMARRLVAEAGDAIAGGAEVRLPAWLGEAIARGDAPIRAARRRKGMTQERLAAVVHVTQGYLSEIENGTKRGTDDLIARVAAALDVDPVWLRDEN